MTHLVDHDRRQNHAEQCQNSQSEDDSEYDVKSQQEVVHYYGEAGLGVDGC